MTRSMRGRIASSTPSSSRTRSETSALAARSESSSSASSSTGRTGVGPSDTTRAPDSSSLRKRTSSMSSVICATSPVACAMSASDVLARERGRLQQRQQPCERRPQLVRDGRGEPRAQLLVRGEVSGPREVDEALATAVVVERDDERNHPAPAGEEVGRQHWPSRTPSIALARAPARQQDAVVLVEDDDRLPALLDERAPARRIGIHRRGCNRRRPRLASLAELRIRSPPGYRSVTALRPPEPRPERHYRVARWRRS